MINKHELTVNDIMPMADYAKVRVETRRRISAQKRNRRVQVGPHVTFYFENFDTMWLQVHEMVFIEKGGAQQVPEELAAYNPLIPKGSELTATFMIEIDDPKFRANVLARLGGIEDTAFITIGGEKISARAEADQDRTTSDGKASSVQFVHFPFTPAQIAAFRQNGAQVILGLSHANYNHMAVLPEDVRAALAADFD
ncbi:MAG: DUF3501 family protein [Alphaproteobacteria bacterium]|nr:DUF3501 family protein [Alphaproteobacteria bacterium]